MPERELTLTTIIYRENGRPLKVDGKLAKAEACCCDGQDCCGCDRFGAPVEELNVSITGAFTATGVIFLETAQEGECWRFFNASIQADPGSGCDNMGSFSVLLRCPVETGGTMDDIELILTPGELSCDFDGVGQSGFATNECNPISMVFLAGIIQGPDADCDCAGGEIQINIDE